MSHDDSVPRHLQPYTLTYSASASQASNSTIGNENGNGPFDPGNTPPLIFAFIALGFTLFGLVIAIIYKRCRPLPDLPPPHYQRTVPVRRPSVQKPTLWDVWIPPNQRVPDEEQTEIDNDWDAFVPLSASLAYPYYPPPPVDTPRQYVQGHVMRPVALENPEHRLYFRQPPADTSLHVAVIISMPKPSKRQDTILNWTRPENEFHVGVTEVKWTG